MLSINGQIRATDSGLELILENQHITELEQNITNTTKQKFDKSFSHNNKQYRIQFDLKKKEKEEGDNFVIPINLLQREGEKELHGVNMKNALSLKDNKKEISVELHPSPKESKEASANRTPPRSVSSSPKNVSPRNSLSGSSSSLELNKTSTENNAKVEELEQGNTNLQTKLTQAEQEKATLQTQLDEVNRLKTELETQVQQFNEQIKNLTTEKENFEKELETAKKEVENKQQKLQNQLTQVEEKDKQIKELNEQVRKLQQEKEKFETDNPNIANLQQQLKAKDEEINKLNDKVQQLQAAPNDTAAQLKAKDEKIKDLEAQLNNQPNAAQLKDKEDKIKELEAKIKQPNTEVENLKKDLQAQNSQVQQLTQKNKELEAKNKTTEQPEQDNKVKYTATVGMGLAAGLVAFTALERTVRLEMLVMVGIAVASAIVAGGITYAVLPSTQVNGVKAQEVNENEKKK